MMKRTRSFKRLTCISALALFAALVVAATASSAVNSGLPPGFGTVCGQVKGASWTFAGQTGVKYTVIGKGGSCSFAMKVVSALTRQKPHAGVLGPHTLNPPAGYKCYATPILLTHAGGCGISTAKGFSGAKAFSWVPLVKTGG